MGLGTALALAAVGCEQTPEQRGQLVVTFQTDMALPKQIDNLRVQVTSHGGRVQFENAYPVGGARNDYRVPGTLALLSGTEPNLNVTVSVAGSKAGKWRTYREITTNIPSDRSAQLRMPIQWLCNESAMPQEVTTPDGTGGKVTHVLSNCDDGTTCRAGTCVPNEIPSEMLPDYAPERVFGDASEAELGRCFDTVACMAPGEVVTPEADCTIAKPESDTINVALRVADNGICEATSGADTMCFVPLDGRSEEGWTLADNGTRLQLPPAVCERIEQRKVLAVIVSTSCVTKREDFPPCGQWSSVPEDRAIEPAMDSTPERTSWPSPELITDLLPDDTSLCCPLLSDRDKLVACGCKANDQNSATLYTLDPRTTNTKTTTLDKRPSPAAVVSDGTLYWAAADGIASVALGADTSSVSAFAFPTGIGVYTQGVLLADDQGLYVLSSGVADPAASTSQFVQLLQLGYDGKLKTMDPLGTRVVLHFAQDDVAFYAGLNLDAKATEGEPFERISSVVRIDKQTHERATVLAEQSLTIDDYRYYGYLDVASDGSDLFALFQTLPDEHGKEHLQIKRVERAKDAARDDPAPIFDLEVSANPRYTTLRLLGAVDGAVLFVREEWETNLQNLRSASLLAIPAHSETVHFVADFAADSPATGLAVRDDAIYWINKSGRVFALERAALRMSP